MPAAALKHTFNIIYFRKGTPKATRSSATARVTSGEWRQRRQIPPQLANSRAAPVLAIYACNGLI